MDLFKQKMEMQELEKKRLHQLALAEKKRLNAAGVTGSIFKGNRAAAEQATAMMVEQIDRMCTKTDVKGELEVSEEPESIVPPLT